MKTVFFILVISIILTGCTISNLNMSDQSTNTEKPTGRSGVPIFKEFDDKVVYTTSQDIDAQLMDMMKADCKWRRGEFKTCGSMCATGDVCPSVCAYTCELD